MYYFLLEKSNKMELKFYNDLTRKKEVFKPLDSEGKKVGFYGCGPTVYWYQHIGSLRRYIFEDVLYKTLKYNGFDVKHIINVTDVGHLTGDSDTGDDKVEEAASKEGKTAEEITRYYFNVFVEDLKKMNVSMPDKWTWASEYIQEQIELVEQLEEKGYTYETSDGIYFDTSKLEDYGHLARLNAEGLEAGKRINIGEKKNKTDFAVWKFSSSSNSGKKRQQEWESPWGIGFPGWHVECTAMSCKHLGKQFDIHVGGIDNMNPHHINEIAQAEAAYGKKPWVNYWLHNNHLNLKEGKMSKSEGKIVRLNNLEEKGYSPMDFRYFLLLTQYRKRIDFEYGLLDSAKKAYERLKSNISQIENDNKTNAGYLNEFQKAINDDLNTPKAVQILWNMIKDEKAEGKIKTIEKMDFVLGLNLLEVKKEQKDIPEKIQELAKEREKARKNKNFGKADEIRDKIQNKGYVIEDSEKGPVVRKN